MLISTQLNSPQVTKKVEINLGYACNAKCAFCYYYDSVVTNTNLETLTTAQAIDQLRLAKKLGIEEIEFTGGEVTLRKDFLDIVAYAKKTLGFRVISMITNGIRLSKRDYVRSLRDAGVDDILFSVHGHNDETHDDVTKVPRSFRHIMEGIDNANELGLRVRSNTVVCKRNYLHLTEIIGLLIEHKIDNINLVMFNPVQQAKNIDIVKEVYVNYADAGREIIRAIQVHEPRLPHFNVRYMPFCFLPGYEKYVTNLDQMNFDPDEWDNYASFRIRKGGPIAWVCAVAGMFNMPYLRFMLQYGWRALCTAGLGRFYVLKDRVKAKACSRCAYEKVCDYLYRDYCKVYGDNDVVPIAGTKVTNPAWVMNAAGFRRTGELPAKERTVVRRSILDIPVKVALPKVAQG